MRRRSPTNTSLPISHIMVRPNKAKVKQYNNQSVGEWTKTVIISISTIIFIYLYRRSIYLQNNTLNFDRCNLYSYQQIDELKELDLSNCGLSHLPTDIGLWSGFTYVTKLDLNNNTLSELPNTMSALQTLDILFLSENKFETIPSVIGSLNRLRVLSLRGNLLTELWATSLPTSSLVWLILTNNKISTIDPNIKEVKLLRKLMLSHNRISSIPVELGECTDLELVRLANNNIEDIPREVLTLSKLAWISISGNPISTSPKEVTKVIPENDIKIRHSEVLGHGASGTVYKARYQDKGVAVKIFKNQQVKGSDGNSFDEIVINGLINHPLVMSSIGVIPNEENTEYKGMVMELVQDTHPLGMVPSFINVTRDEGPALESINLSEKQVYDTIWNICSALEYIHSSASISHGDIYLHNILRDANFAAKLSDFGASFVYDRENNAELADIFERIEVLAFGRLIQDLFLWHFKTTVPENLEKGPFYNLLKSIVQPQQSERPSFSEIKKALSVLPEFSAAA